MPRSLCSIFAIFALAGFTTACGEAVSDDGDGRDDSFMVVVGKADIPNTIQENSPEARAILRVVNSYSRHKLASDVDLYWRSAKNIIDYREGRDGKLGTRDDRIFFTLSELDGVPYVGKTAFRRLRKHVNDFDLIVYDDVVISDIVPDRILTAEHTIVRSPIEARERIEFRLAGVPSDRVLLQLRKADSAKWNPRMAILDPESGEELISTNPWGTADARIPVLNDDVSRGWEIERVADYVVALQNTNDVAGVFEFSLECVGGPCFANGGDDTVGRPTRELRDQELRDRLVSEHQETHIRLSYYDARMEMFSSLDNVQGAVECVYTGTVVETDAIPSNSEMNAEHTWPQSKGAFDGAARSDLHHIYPVTSMVNSLRGAAEFCDVSEVIREMDGAKLGYASDGRRCFEPRSEHKGNAARAMFYFAVVYQQSIGAAEEAVLRSWNERDPIDAPERLRAQRIEVFQGSPQPFIGTPGLVDRIADF